MAARDDRLEQLEVRLARRERRVLLRTTLLTLVPLAAAGVLLWTTVREIEDSQQELKEVNAALAQTNAELRRTTTELRRTATELRRTKAELRRTEAALRRSTNLARYAYNVDLATEKLIASQYPAAGRLFFYIQMLRDRPVSWGFSNTLERGFVSPGFAGYVLQQVRAVPRDGDPEEALRKVRRIDGPPRSGDVILYVGGFAMFYFTEGRGREFVIGMTPVGVIAMKPSFGVERLGILRPRLPR